MKTGITIVLLILVVLLSGCIHQYPDAPDEQEPVSKVDVSVEVTLDSEFAPFPARIFAKTKSGDNTLPDGCLPRFVLEARHRGTTSLAARQVVTITPDDIQGDHILLPINMQLDAVSHTLTVWMDNTRDENLSDTYYHTESLRSVSLCVPYEENYLLRDAFFGNITLDLTSYNGQADNRATARIPLKRPLSHYKVIATDVQEFINKQQANDRPGAGDYEVKLYYQYFLVNRMDATTGELTDSGTGYGYTRTIRISPDMTECELGADYIFARDTRSNVTLTIEVNDNEGNNLSRAVNVEIPCLRGHTTTVSGTFLTSGSGGGSSGGGGGFDIGFDNDYEGEINIDISGEGK